MRLFDGPNANSAPTVGARKRTTLARFWWKALAVLACMSAAAETANPPTNAPPGLDRLMSIYESENAKIENDYQASMRTNLMWYGEMLANSEQELKAKGDVEGVLKLRQERERLAATGTVPSNDAGSLSEIRAVVVRYQRIQAGEESKHDDNMAKLLNLYVARLGQLKTSLLKADNMQGALKVDQEVKKTEFILGEVMARLTPCVPAPVSVKKAAPVNASAAPPTAPTGTVNKLSSKKTEIPESIQHLNGPWKIVRDSPQGTEAKGFVYFLIDNREPWDGWTFDFKEKLWRVSFKRDGWANDMLVFDSMEGAALRGKIYPEGSVIRMIPLDASKIVLPKSVNDLDGYWSYSGVGWSDSVLECKNGKTQDGHYSLRLNQSKKALELTEKALPDLALEN